MQPGKVTAKTIASHFNITVGSIMMYYSVWNNLHPAALEAIISWGDVDYSQLAKDYSIPMSEGDLVKFDDVDVIQKTSMYPGIWSKANQTETFQLRVIERILVMHLRNRPVKPLNKAAVIQCVKFVAQADEAVVKVEQILNDCNGSVGSNIITATDAAQVKSTCEKMLVQIKRGELDGELTLAGEFPSRAIKSVHQRLEAIKMLDRKSGVLG